MTPTEGLTAGGKVLVLTGTGFHPDYPPPASGPVGPLVPGLRVRFGSKVARSYTLSTTQVRAIVPPTASGTVQVFVEHLDSAGVPISGEAVLAGTYTFRLPDPASPVGGRPHGNADNAVQALVRLLRGHVHPNVVLVTHSDYDDTTTDGRNIVAVPTLPAIVLVGPRMPVNRFYSTNEIRTVPDGSGGYLQLRPAATVDLAFDVIVYSEATQGLIALADELCRLFIRLPYLEVPVSFADLGGTSVQYEVTATFNTPQIVSVSSMSNLRKATGTIVVVGVDLDDADGVVGITAPVGDAPVVPGVVTSPDAPNLTLTLEQLQ